MSIRFGRYGLFVMAFMLSLAWAAREDSADSRASEQAEALRGYLGRDMLFVAAPGIESYLTDIARTLLATRDAPPPVPRFLVQSSDQFTVFTDTHGNIVVGSEVLRQVESEDELAAALSHELAHVIDRDAETKNVVKGIPYTVETVGIIAAGVDARTHSGSPQAGQPSGFAGDSLAATQSVGTFWSDLLAPSWNRQQERAADLAGVDMVRAATYDPAAFSTLFTRLDAAHSVRHARVEQVRQEALKKVRAIAPAANAGPAVNPLDQAKGTVVQLGVEAGAAAVLALFDGLANWETDYDAPDVRSAAVLAHVQQSGTGRKDKVRRSPRFAAELRDGDGGRLLEADRAGLELLKTMQAGSRAGDVAETAQLLGVTSGNDPPSPHLNLALGTWFEANRRPEEAEQRAMAWMNAPLAPRTAYLWRASYQASRQDYPAALATLDRGAELLGDRSLFLPAMVSTARASGDMPQAERLAIECGRSGIKLDLGTLSRALKEETPATASGVYGDCVAALGYDPIEKSQQAQTTNSDKSKFGKKAKELNKKLADAFRKLGN